MPSQPNFGLLGGAPNINETVMQALFGEQQRQQNQNVLDQQARADAARQAQARILMRGAGLGAEPQAAPVGNPIEVTRGGALPDVATGPGIISGYGGGTWDVVDGKRVQRTPVQRDAADEDAADLAIIAQADPAQAQAILRQRRMQQDFATVTANPNPQTIARFGMAYPEAFKGLKDAYDVMSAGQKESAAKASADVFGYLKAGDAAGAIRILEQHLSAAKNTGEDVSSYPQLIEMIRRDPKAAQAIAGVNLSIAAPEGFEKTYGALGEERRADEVQPYKVRQEGAKASQEETTARFAPQKAQSELDTEAAQRTRMAAQTANEQADLALKRDGLELDRDKLTSTIQLELEKLDRSGTQLDAGAKQAIGTAVGNSTSAQALADRATSLADRFEAGGSGGYGWASSAREAFKGIYGGQDPITGLKNEYQQIVNQQAVKNLPPGPASDKDIQLAKQGFPPTNASKDYIISFLRGMAKMQEAVAAGENRKANWISANGSLGTTRRDIDVGGVSVPAGTTFTEFDRNAVKRGRQGETPAGIQSIISKYGGR